MDGIWQTIIIFVVGYWAGWVTRISGAQHEAKTKAIPDPASFIAGFQYGVDTQAKKAEPQK